MCIPHGALGSQSNGFVKEEKPKKHIQKVSQSQFEKGDPDVSLAEVMVALEKASVSFQAMTQVRNELLSAYQEVMNMPV